MSSKLPAPTGTGVAWWESLQFEEKLAALDPYLASPGWTNKRISNLFKISLDSVARARDIRKKLLGKRRIPTDNGEENSTERKRLRSKSESFGKHFPEPCESTGNADHPKMHELQLIQRTLYGG